MNDLVFLCKSFSADYVYAKRLSQSFLSFNRDNIDLYFVVPDDDLPLFSNLSGATIKVLSEQVLSHHFVHDSSVRGIRPGYINQQIVKLSFWELGIASNYFIVDSDMYFIRSFGYSDFLYENRVPYSVLVDDKQLIADNEYYNLAWKGRQQLLNAIVDAYGIDTSVGNLKTCHGHTTLNSSVLQDFKTNFLNPNRLTYRDCLNISPYEFSWYNYWLQHCCVIPVYMVEPLVVTFHTKQQHINALRSGFTESGYSRAYLGICINSNYSRDLGVISFNDRWHYGFFNRLLRACKRRLLIFFRHLNIL